MAHPSRLLCGRGDEDQRALVVVPGARRGEARQPRRCVSALAGLAPSLPARAFRAIFFFVLAPADPHSLPRALSPPQLAQGPRKGDGVQAQGAEEGVQVPLEQRVGLGKEQPDNQAQLECGVEVLREGGRAGRNTRLWKNGDPSNYPSIDLYLVPIYSIIFFVLGGVPSSLSPPDLSPLQEGLQKRKTEKDVAEHHGISDIQKRICSRK